MADSISIVMKMNEDVTGKMKSIASASTGCSKEFEALQKKTEQLSQRYDSFSRKSAQMASQAMTIKKAMNDTAKAFKETGDAAKAAEYTNLKQQYDDLTNAAKGYSQAARETIKDMNSVYQESRKLGAGGGNTGKDSSTSIYGMAASGVMKAISGNITNTASTLISSELGQNTASAIESVLSSTLSGVAAGAVAGPWGALIGGGIGAASGLVSAQTQQYQKKDDAFKAYYAGLYETVNQNTEQSLTGGKTLAAKRETDLLSFTTLLKSEDAARAFLGNVMTTANTTPFLYDDLTSVSKTLLSFGYSVEDIIPTMVKVGDAGAALGLGAADIGTVATYLGRMKSSDKASLEYLNPLNERGFAVFDWLATANGVDQKTLYEQISKGQLSGTAVAETILNKFAELYTGQMERQSQTTEGLDSTLQGLMENINAAGGDAFNALRNQGMQADVAAYGGALGDALMQLNSVIGENRAYGENLQAEYQRQALSAVLLGELKATQDSGLFSQEDLNKLIELRVAYAEATEAQKNGSKEAGLQMEKLKEEADALAQAAYDNSEWSDKLHQTNLDQVEAIRLNTVSLDKAAERTLELSNAMSKGIGVRMLYGGSSNGPGNPVVQAVGADDAVLQAIGYYNGSNAYGLSSVPFNGYRAVLHQGERVLTAEQARRQDAGGGGITVNVSGNTVRSDSDLDELVRRITEGVKLAALRAG